MKKYIILLLFLPIILSANIGEILFFKGEVNIIRDKVTLEAFTSIVLEEKDTIKTSENAQAQIVLKDKTSITIGKNTTFKIEEYFYDKEKKSKSKVTMKMKKGIFYAVSGKIGKINKSRFKLKTASASISIRGTSFMGNVDETQEIIGCSSGAISVEAQGISVDVRAGQMTSFAQGSIPSPVIKLDTNSMQVESLITYSKRSDGGRKYESVYSKSLIRFEKKDFVSTVKKTSKVEDGIPVHVTKRDFSWYKDYLINSYGK
ncbi:FecR family protein [Sulfurimonas sp.]